MHVKVFTIPISDSVQAEAEFNAFLSNARVLETEQHFYQNEKGAAWCFCVRYLPGESSNRSLFNRKTDYKEILEQKQFAVFSRLREIRKELAANDVVPAYAVFTDAELAEIAKLPEISEKTVLKVSGIAQKRMEKYGNELVKRYLLLNDDETAPSID